MSTSLKLKIRYAVNKNIFLITTTKNSRSAKNHRTAILLRSYFFTAKLFSLFFLFGDNSKTASARKNGYCHNRKHCICYSITCRIRNIWIFVIRIGCCRFFGNSGSSNNRYYLYLLFTADRAYALLCALACIGRLFSYFPIAELMSESRNSLRELLVTYCAD